MKYILSLFAAVFLAIVFTACGGGRGGETVPSTEQPGVSGAFGPLLKPVPGRIVSPYGMREHPVYGDYRMHTGVDLEAGAGTAIAAAADGYVKSAEFDSGGYGNLVVIRHVEDYETYYAHCNEMYVNPGQFVTRGQMIAMVGSTGLTTGPHLHFEVRRNGRTLDPEPFLAGQ